jgi:hypothetical protein
MPKVQSYVFVLWGERCEEMTAVTWVVELRTAGLRVKLVGVTGMRASGRYGLRLVADLTLSQAQALVTWACCVVVPCNATNLRRFCSDPRVTNLLQQAQAHGARLVVEVTAAKLMNLGMALPLPDPAQVIVYPAGEGLKSFAQEVAQRLVSASEC